MDRNYYSQNAQIVDDFDVTNINDPQFSSYLQGIGGNSTSQNYQQVDGEDEEEENVPETQEPIMTHPLATNPNQQVAVSSSSRSWSVKEDEALISSYMLHCTDILVGTDQKACELWKKVSSTYDAIQVQRPYELPPRSLKMLESRWRRMATDIILWSGCVEEARRLMGSGSNVVDENSTAHKLFRDSVKPKPRNFLCEHGWRMVTAYPKWRKKLRWGMSKKDRDIHDTESDPEDIGGSGKRTRVDANGDTIIESGGSYVSGGIQRPDGVKKTKAKRKGKGLASEEETSSFSEQLKANNEMRINDHQLRQRKFDFDVSREANRRDTRQKEMEIEERHVAVEEEKLQMERVKMKHLTLQTLMMKGTLTPNEEQYKDKLFQELVGDNN
ncbi:glutathione S-transferase T3-like [Spinacia oleracea]|uniref:Glutathione S-transferase T3-like n=1 Tax=Spinacia oleracea TaxID=3562 RepID=A0A9R0I186_SPIOL|nr:glutathione S-transferase T3-like [Spinacia oleracea]